jgi:hypothetical protein
MSLEQTLYLDMNTKCYLFGTDFHIYRASLQL